MNKNSFINGILEIIFIISLFVSIKVPVVLLLILAIASVAIVVNVIEGKKHRSFRNLVKNEISKKSKK